MVILKVVKDSYSDADWAGDYTTDWKSISGYHLEVGRAAGRVYKKQTCVALSTAGSRTHSTVKCSSIEKLCGQLMQDLATQRTSHTNSDS